MAPSSCARSQVSADSLGGPEVPLPSGAPHHTWGLWHLTVLIMFRVLGCSQGMPLVLLEAGCLYQHLDLDVVVR